MDISRVASDFAPRFRSVETVFVVLAVFCIRWFSSGFFLAGRNLSPVLFENLERAYAMDNLYNVVLYSSSTLCMMI